MSESDAASLTPGLAESSGRLKAVIETAVDGIIIIDGAGTVQVFNSACEKLFGCRADEVIGRNVKMLMPSPYRDGHDGYLRNYATTGVRKIIGIGREVVGLRKDGSSFPMELSVGETLPGEDPVYVGIIRDITERKRVEAAVREREARLQAIFETLTDAVVIIDERGLIERIIGIGRVVVALRKDRTTFPMELSVGEMRVDERRAFIGFIRDITERKGTERRLQELQGELLHSSRLSTMGQMASALAHELNQPLTAVINYVQASGRLLSAGADPTRLLDVNAKAAAEAHRAGQIIRRLRDFLEKGSTERRIEDINKVVEEATALALVGSKDTGVKVQLAVAQDLPNAMMDKIQIQQVVLNLVRNAIEAMEHSEPRELAIRTALTAQGDIETAVADSGPGLSAEIEAQLFQPFVSTKRTGMGLGLSICRTIIEAHRGRLWAERNAGGGATFRFTLPSADNAEAV